MGKGLYLSKPVAAVAIVLGVGAVATIIALSVVYSQEKQKNINSQQGGTPTEAPTAAPGTAPTAAPGTGLPTVPGTGLPTVPGTVPTTAPTTPSVTTPRPLEPWEHYRLPNDLTPISYDVTLWPRLTKDPTTGLYIFSGDSTVNFQCAKETSLILIHSNKLNYTMLGDFYAQLSGPGAPTITQTFLHLETQFLVIRLSANLVVGNTYSLYTEFTGELSDDLGGFYRSEYMEDGQLKVLATTQMQPTDARKAFPCFDEPAMKATFNITLLHPEGTVALSNGRQIESAPFDTVANQTIWRTVFQETPKMSTYLLAFIVSEFGHVIDTSGKTEIRIFARKPAIEAGQGDYALNITGKILSFFENYYGVPYPLTKSDQIALPDFSAGAMENWGLITYRETALLYDEQYSSNANKERVATIIGHELAHMWFGNLVTLRWWNDLWLNEGFASYVEYLGAHEAEPTWNVADLIVLQDVHRVFAIDALASSHPLTSREEDIQKPAQISELFDAISYSKGASVLRMLSNFLTEEIFREGLQSYLETFSFSTAVYTDLWNHLQTAVDRNNKSLPTSVSEIMNTWVLQMGFPVVTIDTTTGHVTQRHFLLDPESTAPPSPLGYQWIVPINWMSAGTEQTNWLTAKNETIEAMKTSETLVANLQLTGYYRVNYDQGNWERILDTLNTSHTTIPVINRAQLIDDAFNLARAKIIDTVLALRTTLYLRNERDYMPWQSAINNLDFFYLMFDRSEVYGPLQTYLSQQVEPLFDHYETITSNWANVPTGHMDQYNQVNAVSLACRSGLQRCQDLVGGWFRDWMTTGVNNIHPNLRSTVYCNAIAAGGQVEWDFAWRQFQTMTVATEAEKLRSALACTKQPWLINRFLEYTLNPQMIRKQDATATIISIAGNVNGQSLAWDFVRARWDYIFSQYGGGSFSFSNLINGVTKRFSTAFELQQLEQFKKDNADIGFGSGTLALDQSIERTRANINWLAENKQNVLKWLVDQTTTS